MLMSTSGPTESRKVAMSFSVVRSASAETVWSVEFGPEANPPPYTVAGSPGMIMFVLRAVYPRLTTSWPSSAMSSIVRIGGVPRNAEWRVRQVPQWDQ